MARNRKNNNGKRLITQQSVDQAVKSICDIMRRGNCAGALQYVPELTWILFLRILDEREEREVQEAEAVGAPFSFSLESPYRWRDWAAPFDEEIQVAVNEKTRSTRSAPRRWTLPTFSRYLRFMRDCSSRWERKAMTAGSFLRPARLSVPWCAQSILTWAMPYMTQAVEPVDFWPRASSTSRERAKELKKAKPTDETAIVEAEDKVVVLAKEARDAAARAKEIEDAVYDLKAVNPNKKPRVDTRTPEELLDIIEAKGKEIAEALPILRRSKSEH